MSTDIIGYHISSMMMESKAIVAKLGLGGV
jgi:hypothetical protein